MKLAFFLLFFVYDLEYDIDLEIETIFKYIINNANHTLQK